MSKKESQTEVARIGVEYALNPISNFGTYVEMIAGIYGGGREDISRTAGDPVLISKNGEKISSRSNSDHEMEFVNSELLYNEDVARKIAGNNGYLFFPSGKVEDSEFSRTFTYEDFVRGAQGVLGNIDKAASKSHKDYYDFVTRECVSMEENLKYFNKATLKFDSNHFSSFSPHLVAELVDERIDGFEKYGTQGFKGAWVDMKFDSSGNKKRFFSKVVFGAQFHPTLIDMHFSKQDSIDIKRVVRNVADKNKARELKKGYTEDTYFEGSKEDIQSLDFRFYMCDAEDFGRVLPVGDMIETFTKYLHLINKGIHAVASRKEKEKFNRITDLEHMIKNSDK